MSAQRKTEEKYFTEQEYREMEQASATKHEYVDGQIVAMAGASPIHNKLTLRIGAMLLAHLDDGECVPSVTDQRLKVEASGMQFYPDVLVACPPLRYDPEDAYALVDATVIIEVLSPSTADHDAKRKFLQFQRLPSLRHYVLVSQDSIGVEHRWRDESGAWRIEVFVSPQDTLRLEAIGCDLLLSEIYKRSGLDL